MLPLVDRVARHTDELAIVCRRDPQAPALRNDALCSKADFCQISFGNLGRNILANPALKAGNFRFEFGGVALQLGDIPSELGRRFPQSLRLAPDFPAGKPCDLLSERDCNIRHLSFLLSWCSGNTTIICIIARPHDYVCSDRHPKRYKGATKIVGNNKWGVTFQANERFISRKVTLPPFMKDHARSLPQLDDGAPAHEALPV